MTSVVVVHVVGGGTVVVSFSSLLLFLGSTWVEWNRILPSRKGIDEDEDGDSKKKGEGGCYRWGGEEGPTTRRRNDRDEGVLVQPVVIRPADADAPRRRSIVMIGVERSHQPLPPPYGSGRDVQRKIGARDWTKGGSMRRHIMT